MFPTYVKQLRDLKKHELVKLAKNRKIRIDDNPSTSELVKFLARVVTQKDIDELFQSSGTGKSAVISGNSYEKKCMNYFRKKGYNCELNFKKIPGMEFDIVGQKTEGSLFKTTKFVVVECKNRPKVIMQDLSKFWGNYQVFLDKYVKNPNNSQAWLITSGMWDPTVKKRARDMKNMKLHRI